MKLALKKLDFLLLYITLLITVFGFAKKVIIEVIDVVRETSLQNQVDF